MQGNTMSNQNSEIEYNDFNSWFKFCANQHFKNFYTCLPGIVKSFDPGTKRAKIQVALKQLKTDGTSTSYPIQADVPVIFPASKNYILFFPLEDGDSVIMLFSQRGIEKFKTAYEESEPDKYGFFAIKDAVAIPGFGSLTTTPYDAGAINLQTTDGTNAVSISPDKIDITTPGTVTINASSLIINATTTVSEDVTLEKDVIVQQDLSVLGEFSIAGDALPPDHKHTGVQSGGDDTSTPIP
jgi:hypothetical protein